MKREDAKCQANQSCLSDYLGAGKQPLNIKLSGTVLAGCRESVLTTA